MKRTKLKDRALPSYCCGEEIMNMVTHIAGFAFALAAAVLNLLRAKTAAAALGAAIYSACMLLLYAMSSIYHGLRPNLGKRVLQVLDHCTIYLLIAGTYTPICLCTLPRSLGLGMLLFQWGVTALAVTLTAIDLKKYRVFSMVCYLLTGWAILPFLHQAVEALTVPGFLLLLFGGISYTLGAILYGIGAKRRWFHSVFHLFVVLGSVLQWLSIYFYVL